MQLSKKLYDEAKRIFPGGVNSPVRAYDPYPRYISSAKGSKIKDVDGNEYIDYCMAFGPLILGHVHPHVVGKVREQLEMGTLYGANVELELELARKILQYYDMEMVRFVNSGTEATMSAIRVARGHTGKDRIIMIEGGFHGSHDFVLTSSAGIPLSVVGNTIKVPYNDADAVESAIKGNKDEIAALIIEPVMGNAGVILPKEGYLDEIRELTMENGIVLIFDEVITGFRLGMGGAQAHYGIKPDMTTLGKIVGGGFPIGVFGGSSEMMERVSPSGNIYQAGTFCGNPISMAAGVATIEVLERGVHKKVDSMGEKMRVGVRETLSDAGLSYHVQGIGSMFQIFFTEREVWNDKDARSSDTRGFMDFFRSMLEEGIFLPPSQFETNFISAAHTREDIERTLGACERTLSPLWL